MKTLLTLFHKYNSLLNTFKIYVDKYWVKCGERGWTVIYIEIFEFLESWIFGTVSNPFFILQVSYVTFTFALYMFNKKRKSAGDIYMRYNCTVMAAAENYMKLWALNFATPTLYWEKHLPAYITLHIIYDNFKKNDVFSYVEWSFFRKLYFLIG